MSRWLVAGLLVWLAFARQGFATDRGMSPEAAVGIAIAGWALPLAAGGILVGTVAEHNRDTRQNVLRWTGGAFVGLGIVVGPSTAHLYHGEIAHGAVLSVARLGALALSGLGFIACAAFDYDSEDTTCRAAPTALFLGGLGADVALTIYDFVDAFHLPARHRKIFLMPFTDARRTTGMKLVMNW